MFSRSVGLSVCGGWSSVFGLAGRRGVGGFRSQVPQLFRLHLASPSGLLSRAVMSHADGAFGGARLVQPGLPRRLLQPAMRTTSPLGREAGTTSTNSWPLSTPTMILGQTITSTWRQRPPLSQVCWSILLSSKKPSARLRYPCPRTSGSANGRSRLSPLISAGSAPSVASRRLR